MMVWKRVMVSMACTSLSKMELSQFENWSVDNSNNRKLLDLSTLITLGYDFEYNDITALVDITRYHEKVLTHIIQTTPIVTSPVWRSRMLAILDERESFKFTDFATLFCSMVRIIDDKRISMEQILLTGLLVKIFDHRKPELESNLLKRSFSKRLDDITIRTRLRHIPVHMTCDAMLRKDVLGYRSIFKRAILYLQNSLRFNTDTNEWLYDTVEMCNALVLECCIGYITKGSPYPIITHYIG